MVIYVAALLNKSFLFLYTNSIDIKSIHLLINRRNWILWERTQIINQLTLWERMQTINPTNITHSADYHKPFHSPLIQKNEKSLSLPYWLKACQCNMCNRVRQWSKISTQQGITNTLALPIDKMLRCCTSIYLLFPHSEHQKNPFQSK
jgi:hypothetical protein